MRPVATSRRRERSGVPWRRSTSQRVKALEAIRTCVTAGVSHTVGSPRHPASDRPSRPATLAGAALRPRLATASIPTRHRLRAFRAAGPRSVHAVAKERLKSPRARLFVALDLPDRSATGSRPGRPRRSPTRRCGRCAAESLHVTLCFLSYHPEKAIPRIAELVRRTPVRPVELRFEAEPSPRPKGRPRLYALGAVERSGAWRCRRSSPRRSRPSASTSPRSAPSGRT